MRVCVRAGVYTNVTIVPVFVSCNVAFLLWWTECQAKSNMAGRKDEVKGATGGVRQETGGYFRQRETQNEASLNHLGGQVVKNPKIQNHFFCQLLRL